MQLVFLGTSSAKHTKERSVSAIALNHAQSGIFLFDCGEGTARQLLETYGNTPLIPKPSNNPEIPLNLKLNRIHSIFITHLHGDHCYGLPTLGVLGNAGKKFNLYAPRGIKELLGTSTRTFNLKEFSSGKQIYNLYEDNWLTIKAVPIIHTIFTVGYVIEEKPTKGNILVDKLKEMLIEDARKAEKKRIDILKTKEILPTVEMFRALRERQPITLPYSKTKVNADQVMTDPVQGRKIVILGDTCNPSNINQLAKDCDVLVHEATNKNEDLFVAFQHKHSTAGMAGKHAKEMGAKKLILTHFSPKEINLGLLQSQAAQTFGKSVNDVILAKDFMVYDIPKKEKEKS